MNIAIKIPINVESFISQLSLKDKIELARRLARETRHQRWSGLLSRLRQRVTQNPISGKEILNTSKEARKDMHA